MAIKAKYQGREQSMDRQTSTYKQTFYGKQGEIDTYIGTLSIGSYVTGKGYCRNWRKTQFGADIWQVEVEYTESLSTTFSNVPQTQYGKYSSQLTVRTIQLPLSKLSTYKLCWEFYCASALQSTPPSNWSELTTATALPADYILVKSQSELPSDLVNGRKWRIVSSAPTKLGVQGVDYSYFVITQSAKYGTATAAGNAVRNTINKTQGISPRNDFGLTWSGCSTSWKLDSSNVSYRDSYWLVTNQYTRSATSDGWDLDLYGNTVTIR